jgi:receptor protein-tyrosine kinase
MSLIERAVQKLDPPRDERPLPERAMDVVQPEPPRVDRAIVTVPGVTVAGIAPAQAAPVGPDDARVPEPEPLHIDIGALRARGFVSPDGHATAIGQQFRVIKRPLIANALGRGRAEVANGRRIMVTSALPDEGKSFCAINLAMSIAAERDCRVLLVDADVPRPSLPRELGVQPVAGLMDWLIDGTPDPRELVRRTNVERLSLLQAGRPHEHATELLASSSMRELVDRLTALFPDRIVIFDSPPLLATTESQVLATHMGQIVLVVEAGRTSSELVRQALASVEAVGSVGVVLNKSRESRRDGYYGYGDYANG